MTLCDLCGQKKKCSPKAIEGKDYNICSGCWNPLAEKLKGKGSPVIERETVFLPPIVTFEPRPEVPNPAPVGPPKIWSKVKS
jgi:hypothetical protein